MLSCLSVVWKFCKAEALAMREPRRVMAENFMLIVFMYEMDQIDADDTFFGDANKCCIYTLLTT